MTVFKKNGIEVYMPDDDEKSRQNMIVAAEDVMLFFCDGMVRLFVNVPVTGIQTAVPYHFKVFFKRTLVR